MTNSSVLEWMWKELKKDIDAVNAKVDSITRLSQRAETAGGVPSFTYADAPRAIDGGMSDGTAYIDLVWISDGRSAAEGAGLGTGQLCYYKASVDDYYTVRGDILVTI